MKGVEMTQLKRLALRIQSRNRELTELLNSAEKRGLKVEIELSPQAGLETKQIKINVLQPL